MPQRLRLSVTVGLIVFLLGAAQVAAEWRYLTEPSPTGIEHHNARGKVVDLARWHPRFRELCYLPAYSSASSPTVRSIRRILDFIGDEPTLGNPMVANALKAGTAICIDDRDINQFGYFNVEDNLVAIQADLNRVQQIVVMLHELRHVQQSANGYCPSTDVDLKEAVRVVFAAEADSLAVSALFAWRLRQQGSPDIWRTLQEFGDYLDVLDTFESVMDQGGDELAATRAAFSRWYALPQRRDRYHFSSCMSYLDELDRSKRFRRYDTLPDGYFDRLCSLPDGSNYGCHLTEEIGTSR